MAELLVDGLSAVKLGASLVILSLVRFHIDLPREKFLDCRVELVKLERSRRLFPRDHGWLWLKLDNGWFLRVPSMKPLLTRVELRKNLINLSEGPRLDLDALFMRLVALHVLEIVSVRLIAHLAVCVLLIGLGLFYSSRAFGSYSTRNVVVCLDGASERFLGLPRPRFLDTLEVLHHEVVLRLGHARTDAVRCVQLESMRVVHFQSLNVVVFEAPGTRVCVWACTPFYQAVFVENLAQLGVDRCLPSRSLSVFRPV